MNPNDILIVAAHHSEVKALNEALNRQRDDYEILATGVGGMSMSWALHNRLQRINKPKLVINIGLAGSYSDALDIGDTVLLRTDCFADMGIDDNGTFIPLFSSGLIDGDTYPFSKGRIICDNRWADEITKSIKAVDAATVNMTSGSQEVISRIKSVWNPDVETMEGAWFAYICAMSEFPWISVRTISNMVEPRNKKNWNIEAALSNMKEQTEGILKTIIKL